MSANIHGVVCLTKCSTWLRHKKWSRIYWLSLLALVAAPIVAALLAALVRPIRGCFLALVVDVAQGGYPATTFAASIDVDGGGGKWEAIFLGFWIKITRLA